MQTRIALQWESPIEKSEWLNGDVDGFEIVETAKMEDTHQFNKRADALIKRALPQIRNSQSRHSRLVERAFWAGDLEKTYTWEQCVAEALKEAAVE